MKIRDAREKLIQISKRGGDARLRLMRKMPVQRPIPPPLPPPQSSGPLKSMKKSRSIRSPVSPYYYVPEDDLMMDMEIDEYDADYMAPSSMVLRRTVKNDLAIPKLPPLPTFSTRPDILRRESPVMWSSDPFDCYEVPVGRPADVSEPKHLQRSVRNMNAELMPRKGILR